MIFAQGISGCLSWNSMEILPAASEYLKMPDNPGLNKLILLKGRSASRSVLVDRTDDV